MIADDRFDRADPGRVRFDAGRGQLAGRRHQTQRPGQTVEHESQDRLSRLHPRRRRPRQGLPTGHPHIASLQFQFINE